MSKIIWFLIFVIVGCSQQPAPEFHKVLYDLDNAQDSIDFQNWKINSYSNNESVKFRDSLIIDSINFGNKFYEDDSFKVFQFCNGEFGGAVLFQDKSDSNYLFPLESTCVLMIQQYENNYYITESLAHFYGATKIRKLNSPKSLPRVHNDSLTGYLNNVFAQNRFIEETEILLDTTGIMVDLFFFKNNKKYVVYSDNSKTYLSQLNDQRLNIIDTLLEQPTWTYERTPYSPYNNYLKYKYLGWNIMSNSVIKNKEIFQGEIYVNDDSITIGFKYLNTIDSLKKTVKNL